MPRTTEDNVNNTFNPIQPLCSFLEKNAICEDFQSGFRPYYATETALIS